MRDASMHTNVGNVFDFSPSSRFAIIEILVILLKNSIFSENW